MYTWDPSVESHQRYLSRQSYLGEINATVDKAARDVLEGLSGQTRAVLGSSAAVRATMSDGLGALMRAQEDVGSEIRSHRESVERGFDDMVGVFNWGFSSVLATLGGMSHDLQTLIRIARTPTQTHAYEHFHIARDSYRRGLLEHALSELEKATNGDRASSGYETEWRFHHLRGVIRLGSFAHYDSAVIDLPAAERAFLIAARYARADEPHEAAKAMLAAGFAAYAQAQADPLKLPQALDHTLEAIKLDVQLGEALFQGSKFQAALGNADRALGLLGPAIAKDPAYALRAVDDPDFRRHEDALTKFLDKIRTDAVNRLREAASEILDGTLGAECRSYGCTVSAAYSRATQAAEGKRDGGVLDVLMYERAGLGEDRDALRKELEEARDRTERQAEENARNRDEESKRLEALRVERLRCDEAIHEAQAVAATLRSATATFPSFVKMRRDFLARWEDEFQWLIASASGTPSSESALGDPADYAAKRQPVESFLTQLTAARLACENELTAAVHAHLSAGESLEKDAISTEQDSSRRPSFLMMMGMGVAIGGFGLAGMVAFNGSGVQGVSAGAIGQTAFNAGVGGGVIGAVVGVVIWIRNGGLSARLSRSPRDVRDDLRRWAEEATALGKQATELLPQSVTLATTNAELIKRLRVRLLNLGG